MDDPREEPPSDASPPGITPWAREPVAIYGLEQPVCCPTCRRELDRLHVVRLYRAQVEFVSSLPRSGRLLVCPHCRTPVPGELGAVF